MAAELPAVRLTCSPVSARWCIRHGRCMCYALPGGAYDPNADLDDPGCALHAPGSDHGEDPLATVAAEAAASGALVGLPVYRVVPPGWGKASGRQLVGRITGARIEAEGVVVDMTFEP